MRIVFFGTDAFAAHMLDALQAKHEIVAVVTVPDAPVGRKQVMQETPVAEMARTLNVPVLKPASLKKDPGIESTLKEYKADIFVVAIYSKIIPAHILAIPPQGTINVHPSLLPLYRGPAPIRTPLLLGDTQTGVSIMLMDEEVDHGSILLARSVAIDANDTNITVTEKLANIAAPLLLEAIDGYATGAIVPTPQDHSKATFTRIVKKENGKIDWNKPAQEIYNMWRAYQPWPGIYTTWNGKLLKVIECNVHPGPFSELPMPGTVLANGVIASGDNTFIQIITLQPEGKQPMAITAFLNGNQSFIGSRLS